MVEAARRQHEALKERYVAACKRAYFRYCRGDDAGVIRVAGHYGFPPDRVVDDALDNRTEERRLPEHTVQHDAYMTLYSTFMM